VCGADQESELSCGGGFAGTKREDGNLTQRPGPLATKQRPKALGSVFDYRKVVVEGLT
jgi:hypothetical protein